MNLTTLTHRDALCLNARFTSREEAIHALRDPLIISPKRNHV